MNSVNFMQTYKIREEYASIKERAIRVLEKYLNYPDLFSFNDKEESITFKSERLIPIRTTNRQRVMLLFSNPHPHSVHQGMLLSPNRRGKVNTFWHTMKQSGWILFKEEIHNPKQLATLCLNVKYCGPFEFIFYPYYDFPTDDPKDLIYIFGKKFFRQIIQKRATLNFKLITQQTKPSAVVSFNKGVFNLVSKDCVSVYVEKLMDYGLIQSCISGVDKFVPSFLTFPTDWHYRKNISYFRKVSLDLIRAEISKSNIDV